MKIHKNVEMLLEEHPKLRDDDNLLYLEMCKLANPIVSGMSFAFAIENWKTLGLPDRESVRRSRQKIQAERADLRGSKKATDARFEKYKEMRAYALDETEI